jgi:hypothetical protein
MKSIDLSTTMPPVQRTGLATLTEPVIVYGHFPTNDKELPIGTPIYVLRHLPNGLARVQLRDGSGRDVFVSQSKIKFGE